MRNVYKILVGKPDTWLYGGNLVKIHGVGVGLGVGWGWGQNRRRLLGTLIYEIRKMETLTPNAQILD
jgi:hypothetical protein